MKCNGHVYIATSIDGFIARPNGDIDWLMRQSTKGEDHGYDDFMASVDGLVLGRKSYEKVLSFGAWAYKKPVVVLSRTLSSADIPVHLQDKVTISNATPHEMMHTLSKQGWKNAYIDGGQLIQSFLRSGLIQDIILTHVPILLGKGIPLFGDIEHDVDLQHVSTESYPSGLVSTKYKVMKI
ncbi:MAG: dihydrofolate reductase [Robiginitomaculum sp.]|nr:dihydrofolate reductase [Robiginitomaculum sp.]